MTTRAMMSLALPAPSGTTTVMVRVGQSWAMAGWAKTAAAAIRAAFNQRFVIILSPPWAVQLSHRVGGRQACRVSPSPAPGFGVPWNRPARTARMILEHDLAENRFPLFGIMLVREPGRRRMKFRNLATAVALACVASTA